ARWVSLKDIILPALLVVLVLGSIFLGIATPTEAAGVGAFGSFLVCVLHGRISWKVISDS
ncbi:MAG: TRAP transporter large permease subunit, partial [Gammaproteobacteria bacterium]|nr:TRAP transporter large permease subunit [Gammaproteobacteria bacterium]NIT05458.1 TRAP transporter large permease subunit [Gammaproteobacteria bacterium]NIT41178.1 TRAP transporter large permease subunit [Gammaproteobacteria bacterium]